ncbi:MAG: phosphogluconate dehydratase, partial [Rudaea sp.]|nr:phosphogluconate dehydratase [Rudaea sp.]
MPLNPASAQVPARIAERSRATREAYLDKIDRAKGHGPHRKRLSCGNLAHGFAACGSDDKATIRANVRANIGIINAYNDMLSAHQPYERYPELIRRAARAVG